MYDYPASSRIIFSSFPRATLRDKLVSFLLFATLALVSYIPWPSWFLERTRTSVLGLPSHLPIHEDRFSLYAAAWLSMLFPTAYFLLLPLPFAGYCSELVLPFSKLNRHYRIFVFLWHVVLWLRSNDPFQSYSIPRQWISLDISFDATR